ncbi:metalloregulator ArsR/SmtB family transcription factor [bacterium]|nr:metalloregulator ArsR/SmtB family transcription factor [bacterium]
MDLATLSAMFKAVGDPARLRLLHLLSHEELSVGELVRILEMPQSSISRHLKALKEQGLVADRPIGAATFYRASVEADLGDDDTALRDSLNRLLRENELPEVDRKRLQRTLAMRQSAAGEEFFDRIGSRWDALREHAFGPTFHLEALVRLLPRDLDVADLGAGTGYLLPLLGSHFHKVVAVDMSQQMLDVAKRRIEESGIRNVDLRRGTVESLPLKRAEVDLVLALIILHHVDDIVAVLRQVRHALKPGGRILIVDFQPHQNERFRVAMADRRPGLEKKQLMQWLTDAGFENLFVWDYPHDPHPEHDLAPLPRLYGLIAKRGK